MAEASMSDDVAFFHRAETHALVDQFRSVRDLTIYVGAGSSVERTGLTWAGLTAELLSPEMGSFDERMRLCSAMTPLSASSVVEQKRRMESPSDWRRKLRSDIRSLLARGDDSVTGTFNERVAALVQKLQANAISVALVTPNYDDYLVRNLLESGVNFRPLVLGVVGEGDEETRQNIAAAVEKIPEHLSDPSTVLAVHLHGLVTRDDYPWAASAKDIYPVVSEADYNQTEATSRKVLSSLFEDRNVLILGSSMTDPPLTGALIETIPVEESQLRRLAVIPKQGVEPLQGEVEPSQRLIRAHNQRLEHLGTQLICPDFFVQVPQLVEEFRFVHAFEEGETYADPLSQNRYGRRLASWWQGWFYRGDDLRARQHRDHEIFSAGLSDVRLALRAPATEALRGELWLRWKPEETRDLALWCSTVGTWREPETMRRDRIGTRSRYVSVRAFTMGGVSYFSEPEGMGRWRTYLTKPVWMSEKSTSGDQVSVPVGVISIASMEPGDRSSLVPSNWGRLQALTVLLDNIANSILT